MSRIVTNLLELARPSGFERQLVDLSELAREEMGQMRPEAERASVELELRPAETVVANVNRVQFELVLHNLLRNALQATGPVGKVEVRVGSNGDRAWFEVRDTGPGVPDELRDHIFEPFVTGRQGRGGTGLGLAITRDIVAAHGGTIQALPKPGGGTVMRVELPAKLENA
ncbi:MAG: sensor histidine kinase [Myxococcaceae bacterium]